ncbi:MAG: thermonuclease family protein [Gammaproteobacteria bacterium]|nr:thermonuclease family protein [Gammaproteobacteria bacterium]NIR59134.1 thermonuclease family protein [Gammaproteobacteria bacterium]
MGGAEPSRQGVPRGGAPFALWAALIFATAPATGAPATAGCGATQGVDEHARVIYVYDGDTVRLADGRDIRLIGLDTPEMNHDTGRPEPFARDARRTLRRLLEASGPVGLRHGAERRDRYGRQLAHLYHRGDNAGMRLLEQGLATLLVIPPNLAYLECYRAAERRARHARRGLWSLPRYQPLTASALPRGARGYRVVSGPVTRIGRGRHSTWIELAAGALALRVAREDIEHFRGLEWQTLIGRRVEARGWVYRHRGEARMRLRHPAMWTVDSR